MTVLQTEAYRAIRHAIAPGIAILFAGAPASVLEAIAVVIAYFGVLIWSRARDVKT